MLGVLACASALLVNTWLASRLPGSNELPNVVDGAHAMRAHTPAVLSTESLRTLFGLAPEKDVATSTRTHPDISTQHPPAHHLELRATKVANQGSEWSWAVVKDLDAKTSGVYREGDTLIPSMSSASATTSVTATLVEIDDGYVILRWSDYSLEKLMLGVVPEMQKSPLGAAQSSSEPTPLGSLIEVHGNDIVVPSSERDRLLGDLGGLATKARFMPHFEQGRLDGFRIDAIRADGLFSKLGLQNGDVIQRIAGFSLDSPEALLEVLQKARSANRLEVEMSRNGQANRLTLVVQ